ncbi:MAG: NAD-dependent epimerase/dehydratase family protein [Colwellia sp.]|nr:NAD-dependent epimerase/dehydratase family protein [Colwellia sp.]
MKAPSKKAFASVGIIGCGWLGTALASTLLEKGILVLVTSSKLENVHTLNQQGINAQQLTLPTTDKLAQHDIFSQQCLVLAIPPQFKQGRVDYADKITQLVDAAKKRGIVQRIILLSSMAIYAGLSGLVDESSTLTLASEKAEILHQAEQAVLAFNRQKSVLRLSGLVGPNRHPGTFLQAKKALENAIGRINLIHQQDAVGLILSLLTESSPQGVFNGVSSHHATKKAYYQQAAKALSLPIPVFLGAESLDLSRIVSGEKAKLLLNHSFIYPDLLAWL